MIYGSVPGLDRACSRLVLGTMAFSSAEKDRWWRLLDRFVESGGNCIDTALIYQGGESELIIGQWLKARGIRGEVIVLTKGAHPKADGKPRVRPEAIAEDLEISLNRLGVESIDLYLLHRDDPSVPVDEIVDALNREKGAGRLRAFGGSNWSVQRLQAANEYALGRGMTPFAASSPQFSLALTKEPRWPGCTSVTPEDLRWYQESQMPLFAWSSQASGFFAGRIARHGDDPSDLRRVYDLPENWARLARAERLAKAKGQAPTQIALAYVLCQPFPTFPLIGPLTEEELAESLAATKVELTSHEVMWLDGRRADPPFAAGVR